MNLSLKPETATRLDVAAKRIGEKKSKLVDDAINEYLDRVETEKPQS